jgi:hypothetical protein
LKKKLKRPRIKWFEFSPQLIRRAERDMESVWMDQVEMRDLQDVKNHMKEVEYVLCMLQEEVGHIESSHCREA